MQSMSVSFDSILSLLCVAPPPLLTCCRRSDSGCSSLLPSSDDAHGNTTIARLRCQPHHQKWPPGAGRSAYEVKGWMVPCRHLRMSTSSRPPPHQAHRLDPPAPDPDDTVALTLPATLITFTLPVVRCGSLLFLPGLVFSMFPSVCSMVNSEHHSLCKRNIY